MPLRRRRTPLPLSLSCSAAHRVLISPCLFLPHALHVHILSCSTASWVGVVPLRHLCLQTCHWACSLDVFAVFRPHLLHPSLVPLSHMSCRSMWYAIFPVGTTRLHCGSGRFCGRVPVSLDSDSGCALPSLSGTCARRFSPHPMLKSSIPVRPHLSHSHVRPRSIGVCTRSSSSLQGRLHTVRCDRGFTALPVVLPHRMHP